MVHCTTVVSSACSVLPAAFHMGDEQHDEFSIEALTVQGWMVIFIEFSLFK